MVPGGDGVDHVLDDAAALEFVRRQAAGAMYVTSVCTGSLVLGTAGLLKGKRATTHWAFQNEFNSDGWLAVFGGSSHRTPRRL